MRSCDVKKDPNLGRPAQIYGALEGRNGLADGAPAEGDKAQGPVGEDEAAGLIDLAGDPEGLLGARHRFPELAQLDEAPGEVRSRADRSQHIEGD